MAKFFKFFSGTILKYERFASVLLIIIISGLCFLLFVPKLGIYFDDWFLMERFYYGGVQHAIIGELSDRPVAIILRLISTSIARDSIIAWHILTFCYKIVGATFLMFLIRRLWSDQIFYSVVAALLFVVYPGFTQQPVTLMHQVYHLGLALYLFSLWLTAIAQGRRSKSFIVLSITASLIGLIAGLSLELLIGLEGLRLVIVGKYRIPKFHSFLDKLKALIKGYFVYLVINIGIFCVFWLVFFGAGDVRRQRDLGSFVSQGSENVVNYALEKSIQLVRDTIESTVFAWFVSPNDLWAKIDTISLRLLMATLFVSIVAGVLVIVYAMTINAYRSEGSKAWAREPVLIALALSPLTFVPLYLGERHIILQSFWNRYTLPSLVMIALMSAGLVFLLFKRAHTPLVLAFLVALSVGTHFLNSNNYAMFWSKLQQSLWQVYWRIPSMEANTVVLVDSTEMDNQSYYLKSFELASALNILYMPDASASVITDILSEDTIRRYFNRPVLILYISPSCVRVIDSLHTEEWIDAPSEVRALAEHSTISLVGTSQKNLGTPPISLFDQEPEKTWCYYYQKADLARQMGNWTAIVDIARDVKNRNLTTTEEIEWFPIIEGLVHTGNYEQATTLVESIVADPILPRKHSICGFLSRMEPLMGSDSRFDGIIRKLDCIE